MRTVLLSLFFLLPFVILAQDQAPSPKKTPEAKAKARTEEMTKDLGLTSAQAAQVEALWAVHYRRTAENKSTVPDEKVRKERLNKAKETHRNALKRVLTAEQHKRMLALDAERKAAKKAAKASKAGEAVPKTK